MNNKLGKFILGSAVAVWMVAGLIFIYEHHKKPVDNNNGFATLVLLNIIGFGLVKLLSMEDDLSVTNANCGEHRRLKLE